MLYLVRQLIPSLNGLTFLLFDYGGPYLDGCMTVVQCVALTRLFLTLLKHLESIIFIQTLESILKIACADPIIFLQGSAPNWTF